MSFIFISLKNNCFIITFYIEIFLDIHNFYCVDVFFFQNNISKLYVFYTDNI